MVYQSHKNWSLYALLIGIVLVILTGGATHEIGQLFLLGITGLFLVFVPVKKIPGYGICIGISAIFLWGIVQSWIPMPVSTASDWIVEKHPSFTIGNAISVQPLLSVEKLMFLGVGVSWLLMVIQHPLSHYRRIAVLKWTMFAVGGLALITVICIVLKVQHPFTWGTHIFSFFPNHNQSGCLFALGGILSMGFILRAMKKRQWDVFLYMGVLAVIALTLFMGMSRSSVLILTAGCLLTFIFSIEKRNTRFYLKLGVPFVVFFLAVFLLYGGKLVDEFVSVVKTGGIGEELRVRIWFDALSMVKEFPLFGVGFGNFRYYFPFFQNNAATSQAVHHPESDFLWVWAESGTIGLLLVLFVLALLLIRLDPREMIQAKSSRFVGFVAVVMFLLAGLIEVSGHRLGTAMLAVFIYGVTQPEKAKFHEFVSLPWISRLFGILFLALASWWGYLMVQPTPFVSSEVLKFTLSDTNEIFENHSAEEVDQLVDDWIVRYPMMFSLHNLKGITAVSTGNFERAKEGFDKSHLLSATRWKTYANHGLYIYPLNIETALGYWNTALERAGENRLQAFDYIGKRMPFSDYPKLRDLTYQDRSLQFKYFDKLRGSALHFSRELGLELAINPQLQGFSSEQKQALLWYFTTLNGPTMLRRLLERHPDLGTENWTIRAQMEGETGNPKEAARLAVMNFPEPEMIDLTGGRTLSALRTEYLIDPDDSLKVVALVQKQLQSNLYEDAIVIVEVASKRNIRNEYLDYQLALLQFQLGRYGPSWQRWKYLIQESLEWNIAP